jgi:hypothetical protein
MRYKEIITIVIIISFLILLYQYFKKSNITFIEKFDAISILQSDDDGYMSRLNKINLKARYVKTLEEYKDNLAKSVHTITMREQYIINKAIWSIKCISFESPWLLNDEFHNMPWNIIVVKGKLCDNGYPHTRFNNIIIPLSLITSLHLSETLFHEQLHVYQKTYPQKIENYVNKHYVPIIVDQTMIRANPDTNTTVYKDHNNNIYCCKFNNNFPTSLSDVTYYPNNESRYEHPYEKVVYDLVEKYF